MKKMLARLQSFWNKLSNIGLKNADNTAVILLDRIRVTNRLAGITIFIFLFLYATDRDLWVDAVFTARLLLVIAINSFILLLNHLKCFLYSRLITTIYFVLIYILPQIFFGYITALEVMWFPFALIFVSLIPLMLFDLERERVYWILMLIFYGLLLLFFVRLVENTTPEVIKRLPVLSEQFYAFTRTILSLWLVTYLFFYYIIRRKDVFETNLTKSNQNLSEQMKISQNLIEEIQIHNEELKQNQIKIEAQKDRITAQKNKIQKSKEKLARFQKVLMELSQSTSVQLGSWMDALKLITYTASIHAKASRVSIWQYGEDKIICLTLFNAQTLTYKQGTVLYAKDYPRYFTAIAQKEIIVASKAHQHPDTAEFFENYLSPLEIKAMLDAPFFVDGELQGVICLEHQDNERKWSLEDVSFVKSLADVITIAYKSYLRKIDLEQIQKQNQEIALQNQVLQQQKELIDTINQGLEYKIKERTAQLESQNKRLAEYAFINAHHLRGPLCRIMGLLNLLEIPELADQSQDFIPRMRIAANELDEVINSINERLEDEDYLEAEDLQILRQKGSLPHQ